ERVDGSFDAACDGAVDGVARFGTVDGDDGDVAADFEIDHLRASGWVPASGVRNAQQVAQMPAIVNERRKPGLSRFIAQNRDCPGFYCTKEAALDSRAA